MAGTLKATPAPIDRAAARANLDALGATLGASTLAVSATLRPETFAAAAPSERPGSLLPRLDTAPRDAGRPTAELELERLLGEGGMGAVWLARQRSLDREVAVKRLKPDAGPAARDALLSEGRATGRVEHPNVIPVHALGVDEAGAPLLVMKRVEGATLEALRADLAHPAWPALERRWGDRLGVYVEVLMRVADALELAHSRGLVHRDVKPENVMIGAFGEVYLLDWGIALERAALPEGERTRPRIVGTPSFMAPELVAGVADRVDARTDVYLLGATLHVLLTGRPRHDGETLHAVLVAALVSDPPALGDDIDPELAELVRSSTAAEPGQRPATASAFRDALAAFLRHRDARALARSAEARLETLRPASETTSAETARALLECRFALRRALETLPGDEAVIDALDRTLRALTRAELARRSPDAAAAFAAELSTRDVALDREVAALREALAEGRRLEEAARREAHERDPAVAAGARLALVTGILGIGVGLPLVLSFAGDGMTLDPHAVRRVSLGVNATLVSGVGLAIFAARRRLLQNRATRHAVISILAAAGALLAVDGATAWLDTPELDAMVLRNVAVAATLATTALTVGPVALVSAACIAAAGLVMLFTRNLDAQRVGDIAALLAVAADTARTWRTGRTDGTPR